ncbi:hypothetical protein EDB86DRAFT_2827850 [Lactarius hatsudake]|nr:hypothetical protein EDB86DRAFT_2827850 [Lactarius hatsudake]
MGLVVAALRAVLRWCGGSVGSCATWRSLGVCWVGVVVSRQVAGCCMPCRGGVGVGGGWRGVACRVGVAWGLVAGGGVLRAVSGWHGGRWRLGLVCHVEAAWRVGGVLRIVLRQHGRLAVVGCCVPYWGGVVLWYCEPCWGGGGGVSRVMSGWCAGAGWLEMTCMLKAAAIACNVQGEREKKKKKHISNAFGPKPSSSLATFSILRSRGIASHVGAACWGGDEWRWLRLLACTRGRQWPAALKPWGWSMWNNSVVFKPPLDTTYHILSHTQTPSLVDAPPLMHMSCLHSSLPQYTATANPPHHPNMARKTFDPMFKISHLHTRATSILPQHPATANPLLHPNTAFRAGKPLPSHHRQPTTPPQHDTQDLHCQPTTTLPQHGRQRPATPNPHATLTWHKPCHPLTHSTPTQHSMPRPCQPTMPPQHDAQDPANPPRPFNTARKAPATTNPHTTLTWCTTPQPCCTVLFFQ